MRLLTLARFALVSLAVYGPAAAQDAPIYGPELSLSGSAGGDVAMAVLDEDTFVVGYRSYDEAVLHVGQVEGDGSVILAPGFPFQTGLGSLELQLEALDASRFVATFRNNGDVFAIVGDVDGLDIAYGPKTFLEANSFYGIDVAVLDPERFVAAYSDYGPGRVRVCSVDGTTVSLGVEVTFESTYAEFPQIATLDGDRFVVVFRDDDGGYAIVGEASSTASIHLGSVSSLPGKPWSVAALGPDEFVFSYRGAGSPSAVAVGAVQGLVLTGVGPGAFFGPAIDKVLHAWVEALGDQAFTISWYDGIAEDDDCINGTCAYNSRNGVVSGGAVASLSSVVGASETSGAHGSSFNFDSARVGAGDAYVIAYSSPGSFLPYVRRAQAGGDCAIRNGGGLNPSDYACGGEPAVGETWISTISTEPSVGFTTAATIIGFGLGGPVSGVFLGAGELLVLPPFAQHIALGTHQVPVGSNVPVGLTIASQGARVEVTAEGGIAIVLLNGIDLFTGG